MSDSVRAILFAAILSVVCCVLITAACTGLQKYQVANEKLDRQINIVKAVGLVDENKTYTREEINRLYTDNIVKAWVTASHSVTMDPPEESSSAMLFYFLKKNERLDALIIPLNVRGLWGRISGYLAVQQDGETVKGFTVASHAETPGLGGEIETRWFRDNFSGKKIFDQTGKIVSVSVAKGSVKDGVSKDMRPYYVDGISGATLTGKYLSTGIKETLDHYEKLLRTLRDTGRIL